MATNYSHRNRKLLLLAICVTIVPSAAFAKATKVKRKMVMQEPIFDTSLVPQPSRFVGHLEHTQIIYPKGSETILHGTNHLVDLSEEEHKDVLRGRIIEEQRQSFLKTREYGIKPQFFIDLRALTAKYAPDIARFMDAELEAAHKRLAAQVAKQEDIMNKKLKSSAQDAVMPALPSTKPLSAQISKDFNKELARAQQGTLDANAATPKLNATLNKQQKPQFSMPAIPDHNVSTLPHQLNAKDQPQIPQSPINDSNDANKRMAKEIAQAKRDQAQMPAAAASDDPFPDPAKRPQLTAPQLPKFNFKFPDLKNIANNVKLPEIPKENLLSQAMPPAKPHIDLSAPRIPAPQPDDVLDGKRIPTPQPNDVLGGKRIPAPQPNDVLGGKRIPTPQPNDVLGGKRIPTPQPNDALAGRRIPTQNDELNGRRIPTQNDALNGRRIPTPLPNNDLSAKLIPPQMPAQTDLHGKLKDPKDAELAMKAEMLRAKNKNLTDISMAQPALHAVLTNLRTEPKLLLPDEQEGLSAVPESAADTIKWDKWHEQFAQLAQQPILSEMQKGGNPAGNNTVRITVFANHRVEVNINQAASSKAFDSAMLKAYQSLSGNPALQYPDGSRRSSVTFLVDNRHDSTDQITAVKSTTSVGDKELLRRH